LDLAKQRAFSSVLGVGCAPTAKMVLNTFQIPCNAIQAIEVLALFGEVTFVVGQVGLVSANFCPLAHGLPVFTAVLGAVGVALLLAYLRFGFLHLLLGLSHLGFGLCELFLHPPLQTLVRTAFCATISASACTVPLLDKGVQLGEVLAIVSQFMLGFMKLRLLLGVFVVGIGTGQNWSCQKAEGQSDRRCAAGGKLLEIGHGGILLE
jgi:hypothetical protein